MPRRGWGTGHLYEKHGSYYARWRTGDGRLLNRKVGPMRTAGARDGLTRSEAEKEFRRMQAAEEQEPRRGGAAHDPTLAEASAALRRQLPLRGSRPSYLENCESMDRIHICPLVGTTPVADIKPADIEAVAQRMLSQGLSPKTVRNVLTYVPRSSSMRSSVGSWARIPSDTSLARGDVAKVTQARTSDS